MINTIPSVEEIVEKLEWPDYDAENWLELWENCRVYRIENSVEIKHGKGWQQNIVERTFGELSEKDRKLCLKNNTTGEYIESFRFPTLREAVRACIVKIVELDSEWYKNYTDARLW